MSLKKLITTCCVAVLMLTLAVCTWSQGTTSRISGVVTDASGSVVPGAKVTVTNDGTGATFTITTSNAGTYAFDSLQPGKYTIKVQALGFKAYRSSGNELSIGIPTSVNPKLQIGEASETVEVSGGYDLIQTESSGNFGGVIDNVAVTSLPVVGTRGRNPLGMVQYMPGVINNGANATGGGISVNGSRDRAWNYVLDGIDANESSSGGSNTSPPHQNPDMLAEFRVITASPTAEFGRSSGAQVLMVTKSGSNQFHGNLFWFYQTPMLRANTPQNKSKGYARSQYIQHMPGGSFGGPILKDKAFFFFNLELLHAATSTLANRTVYTDMAKKGIFRYSTVCRNLPYGTTSTSTACPQGYGSSVDASGNVLVNYGTYDIAANDPFGVGLDTSMKAFWALAPSPNDYTVGDGLNYANYSFVAPSTDKQVDTTVKFDYRFSEKNTMYFRWMGGHQNTLADSGNSGLQMFPGMPATENTFRFPRNIAINDRWSPNNNFTNEVVIGMNRFGYRFEEVNADANKATPFNSYLVTAPLNSALGNSRFLTTYQAVDNVTYVRGAHVLKAGVNLRYGREIDERGSIGSYSANPQVYLTSNSYMNLADTAKYNTPTSGINTTYDLPNLNYALNDVLGRISQVNAGYVAKADLSSFKPAGTMNFMDARWPEYDFFVQDTWHATPNLVFDFGLRMDARLQPDFKTLPGLVPNQTPRYGQALSAPLSFVHGEFFKDRWNNFAPSVGFAYNPGGSGKTSIRGNFRIAYDRVNSFSFSSSVFQGMPGLLYTVNNTTAGSDTFSTGGNTMGMRAKSWSAAAPTATPASLLTPPTYSANSITVSDPDNMKTPTVNMWALSIQREVMHNTVLTVSYVGNHAVHLYGGYDSNQSEINSNGFVDAFNLAKNNQDSPLLTSIISSDTRRKSGETGTAFVRRQFSSYLNSNSVGALANSLAQRLQNATTANPNGVPLVVSSGLPANFFKPYSQYLGGVYVLETRGYSNYNGLQAQIERRMTQGFLITANYAYSKSLDIRSFDPTFTLVATGSSQSAAGTPFDYHKPQLNYGAADFDNTHVVTGYFTYQLPFGRKAHYFADAGRLLDTVIGGWQLSGAGNWQSGRPVTLYSGAYTFQGTVYSTPNCTGKCDAHMGKVHKESGQLFWLTQAQRGMFSTPDPGEQGNIGRNWLRQNATWNADAALLKEIHTVSNHVLQIRFEAQNVFNTVSFDTMGSQSILSSVFARLNAGSDGVINTSPRRAQLALKYVF